MKFVVMITFVLIKSLNTTDKGKTTTPRLRNGTDFKSILILLKERRSGFKHSK